MEKVLGAMVVACALACSDARARGVLDPAVYLSPGPPLAPAAGDATPEQRWAQPPDAAAGAARATRDADDLLVLPLKSDDAESMSGAETFWSGYRPAYVVPVSYGYAGYGAGGDYGGAGAAGGYAPGYAGLAGGGYGGYGAGSYGAGVSGWSGWGHGKWGHYGSG